MSATLAYAAIAAVVAAALAGMEWRGPGRLRAGRVLAVIVSVLCLLMMALRPTRARSGDAAAVTVVTRGASRAMQAADFAIGLTQPGIASAPDLGWIARHRQSSPIRIVGWGVEEDEWPEPSPGVVAELSPPPAGDWNRLWELAPPNELPLYDYRAALTQAMGDDEAPNFSIDAFEASTEVNGDAATITVRANGVMEEGGNWSIDDRCLSIDQVEYYEDTPETYTNNFCPSSAQNPMFGVTSLFLGYGEERAAEDGYVRFTAVKHNDRWFLSPVGSALAMLDHVIANASDESIYAMFAMYDAMEVDGSITLGTEVRGTVEGTYEPRIYTFEGQQGQSVIGTFQAFEDTEYGGYADTYLYGPDGTQIYDAYGLLQNQTLELPADGTYRLVVLPTQRGEFAFTLYDAANAPEDVLNPPHECTTEGAPDYCAEMIAAGCTFGPNNSSQCPESYYSGGAEACSTLPDGTASCAVGGEETCTVLPDGSEKCGGEETCTVLPDGSEECTISSGAELTPTTAVEGVSGDEGSAFAPAPKPAPVAAPTSVP